MKANFLMKLLCRVDLNILLFYIACSIVILMNLLSFSLLDILCSLIIPLMFFFASRHIKDKQKIDTIYSILAIVLAIQVIYSKTDLVDYYPK